MAVLTPISELPPLKKDFARDRVYYSLQLLYLRGFVSEAENRRVKERIRKWREKWTSDELSKLNALKLK